MSGLVSGCAGCFHSSNSGSGCGGVLGQACESNADCDGYVCRDQICVSGASDSGSSWWPESSVPTDCTNFNGVYTFEGCLNGSCAIRQATGSCVVEIQCGSRAKLPGVAHYERVEFAQGCSLWNSGSVIRGTCPSGCQLRGQLTPADGMAGMGGLGQGGMAGLGQGGMAGVQAGAGGIVSDAASDARLCGSFDASTQCGNCIVNGCAAELLGCLCNGACYEGGPAGEGEFFCTQACIAQSPDKSAAAKSQCEVGCTTAGQPETDPTTRALLDCIELNPACRNACFGG